VHVISGVVHLLGRVHFAVVAGMRLGERRLSRALAARAVRFDAGLAIALIGRKVGRLVVADVRLRAAIAGVRLTAALAVAITAATAAAPAAPTTASATLTRAVTAFAFLAPRPAGLALAALGMLALVGIVDIPVLVRVGCILVATDVLDTATRVVGIAAPAFLALATASAATAAATAARTAFLAVATLAIAVTATISATLRGFACLAAGSRLLGVRPSSGEFEDLLPPDAMLEVAPDGSDLAERLDADRDDAAGWSAVTRARDIVRADHTWTQRADRLYQGMLAYR